MPYDHDKQCQDNSIVVDTSNAPSPGWVGVVATAKTMSVVLIQANRCCGSVPCISCSSDLNPPRFIPHSAIEWRHRRLFGETLSSTLSIYHHLRQN